MVDVQLTPQDLSTGTNVLLMILCGLTGILIAIVAYFGKRVVSMVYKDHDSVVSQIEINKTNIEDHKRNEAEHADIYVKLGKHDEKFEAIHERLNEK